MIAKQVNMTVTENEDFILEQLKAGNNGAYKYLYEHHYSILCHFAEKYLRDPALAENIVEEVIFHLWENRDSLSIRSTLRSYLMQSVRNKCLDELKSLRYRRYRNIVSLEDVSASSAFSGYVTEEGHPLGELLEKEMEDKMQQAIASLPDECRKVYLLSREESLSQKEIAQRLGISVNTVKYHMKNALRILTASLKKYLYIWIILMIH